VRRRVLPKKNPQELEAVRKYYLQVVKTGTGDVEWLAHLIANQCTIREADCVAVLHALVHNMLYELSNGRIVQLGVLGNFQVGVRSHGTEQPQQTNISQIKSVHLNFRPSLRVKRALNSMHFTVKNR